MKKSYLQEKKRLSMQVGGTMSTIYMDLNNDKKYSGAGMLLLEKYKNEPVVILFKSNRIDRNNNYIMYEDLGGGIDKEDLASDEPLKTTAIREAFEESRGLINIQDPKHIGNKIDGQETYIDQKHKDAYYRSYLIGIDHDNLGNLLTSHYCHNKQIIDKHDIVHGISSTMKETSDIDRFYIKDLINDGILNIDINNSDINFICRDINNNKRKLFRRTVITLIKAINDKMIKKVIDNPIKFIQLKSAVTV